MGGSFCYSHCSKERWFPVWDHLITPTSVISLSIQCNNCVAQRSISMTKANQLIKKKGWRPSTVVCTYSPNTQEAEAEEWSRVWGQPVYIASSSIVRVTQLERFSKIGTRKEEKAQEEEEEEWERKEEAAKKQNNVQQCPLSTLTHICFSVSLLLRKIVHICHTLLLPPGLCSTYLEQLFSPHSTEMALTKISSCIWFSKVSWLFLVHILLITQPQDWLFFLWNTFYIKYLCSDLPLLYLPHC